MVSDTDADGCSPPDEMDLVARIIAGDSGLFHELVRPYERDAYLIAFSILLHPDKAEEIVQEAFISAAVSRTFMEMCGSAVGCFDSLSIVLRAGNTWKTTCAFIDRQGL